MLHLLSDPLPEFVVLSDGGHFLRKIRMLRNEQQELLVYKPIIQPRIIQQFVDAGADVNICQQPISRGFCAVIPGLQINSVRFSVRLSAVTKELLRDIELAE